MKIKSMALLLIVVSSFMLLLSPLSSVSTTLAQQEKVLEQGVGSSNNQVDKTIGNPCAMPPVNEAKRQEVEEALKRFRQDDLEASGIPGSVTIQVYFHVINRGPGLANGDVPEYVLDNQIAVLNNSFSGMTGGANTSFRFVKACAAIRIYKPEWFQMTSDSIQEREAKSQLRRGGANALNFYTVNNSYGWARFPWDYASNPCLDGVAVPFTMLPGGSSAPFNEGDIGTHEVGHWLGLWHTFQETEDGSECWPINDKVDDTPAHKNFIGGCPTGQDTCPNLPGLDPIHNFMQNASDACKYQFTNGQSAQMDNMYAYRQSGAPPSCYMQLFPTLLPSTDALSAVGTTWEQATQFSSSINGRITHIRFYKSPYETGTHVGWIWSEQGTLLARAAFTNETASGWQEAAVLPPHPITAGVKYRVSYNINIYGVKTFAGLNTPITNGPLTAHTSYYSMPAGSFPSTNSGSILFADVRFNAGQ
jgi:Pregnancy-associated plasma protein-A.